MRCLPLVFLFACQPDSQKSPRVPDLVDETVYDVALEPQLTDAAILEELFSGDTVEAFELSTTQWTITQLTNDPDTWRRADFTWRGRTFHDVGIRVKGMGSFSPITQKPSLKIEFDKFVDGQDFFGLDTLVLNNMISDHTKVKERLAYTLYREAGVPAARAAHSTLRLNDVTYGLYTHMEDVDDRMLAHWFADPNGPLFELFDVVLQPADVDLFQHEQGPDDRTVLLAAANDLILPREEAIVAVEDHVDIEAFLTYYAVSGVIGQFDAWPFNNPGDDVHLYVDPTSNALHFVPHGLDESFNQFFRNVAIPGGSLLGQACYFTEDCNARLEARIWEVWDLALAIDLGGQAQAMSDQIYLDAAIDLRDQTTQDDLDLFQEILLDYIDQREAHIEENLGPR